MLTGNLLLYTRRKGRLIPRMLDPAEPALLDAARALLQLVEVFRGRRRGELEEALRTLSSEALPGVQAKVGQGLAKLLLDRCEFEVGGTAEPVALRRELFEAAAQAWRDEGAGPLANWRERVIGQAARAHGATASQVGNLLYADLAENHVLTRLRPLSPRALLHRYNTAQVQGLLLRADRIILTSPTWPSPQRLRQLFRYLKFFGLLFALETPLRETPPQETPLQEETPPRKPPRKSPSPEGDGAGAFALVLDGPLSVLEAGSRYGLNLAQFLPVLLHWEQPWKLECLLRPRPGSAEGRLELRPHAHLQSHYPDQGQWVAEEVRQFAEGFNALNGSWTAHPATDLVALPGNRYLIPDFVFRPAGSRKGEVLLEYLRYPSWQQLARRMELVESNGIENYIVACKDVPALGELPEAGYSVFTFRRNLLPAQVHKFLEGRH